MSLKPLTVSAILAFVILVLASFFVLRSPMLRVSPIGTAVESCSSTDGAAIDLVFPVFDALQVAPTFTGQPVGNQVLKVRANSTLSNIKQLRRWQIQNPDSNGGLLAWVCQPYAYPCNFVQSGSVLFTHVSDKTLDGEWSFYLESGHRIEGKFSASFLRGHKAPCG
ncbi:MAG: hypothetical protein ABIP34_18170 [Rhodoferax sp.]|uniref:hypothetical protein n=1 Tax=Rhodoferax sp. TaxID=50421 RepID=UPI003266B02E